MIIVLGGVAAWTVLATGIALVLGRVMRSRDQRCGPCDVDAYEVPRLADGGVFL